MDLAHPVTLARESDAAEIAGMSRRLIEHGLPWNWRSERVARAIAAADTNVAVVRGGRSLAGFGIMEYRDDDAYLVLLAVESAAQRRGIGSALLQWLESSAVTWGCLRVSVDARLDNAPGRLFYNERGYHEIAVRRRWYSGQLDAVRLEKWLRPAAP